MTVLFPYVKDGNFTGYPDHTVGQAAACFFGTPKWSTLTGKDGATYVNLEGRMTLGGEPVDALLQFRVDKSAQTFQMNAFEIDDVPQNDARKLELIAVLFGEDGCG